MKNRRQILQNGLAIGAGLALAGLPNAQAATQKLPSDFHHQDWFFKTSFDLRQDMKTAANNGKELVLLWEQSGCHYCRQMHRAVFTRKDIVELITSKFEVIQMDLRGNRQFTGLDGRTQSEAEIATGYLVNATPTTLFFDEDGDITFRAPGYVPPPIFKGVYQYVIEKAYGDQDFFAWVKTQNLK